jgi:hypothetical protein
MALMETLENAKASLHYCLDALMPRFEISRQAKNGGNPLSLQEVVPEYTQYE